MPANRSLYHLDAEDYVHITQTTGAPIEGKFDGVDYVFEDGVTSEPVHWKVAHHIFGFRGTEVARINALHRLGWLHRMDMNTALSWLKQCVSFQPLELLPKGVLEFRKREPETNEASPVMPTAEASSPVEPGAPETASPALSDTPPPPRRAPHDPLRKAKQG